MAALFPLIDAHNHLQDEWLEPHRAAMLRDLETLGIARAVVNGTSDRDWDRVDALARDHAWVLPSYGIHPWYLDERTPRWQKRLLERVERTGDSPKTGCAIGEIGLDRWKRDDNFEEQKEVFAWQLALAAERNLPATIHCLKAWGALWEILREKEVPKRGFLLHSYGGPVEMVDGFARRGAYFSFPGYFLGARKEAKRETFRHIPPDRLLVETDAPAMPLPPERRRFSLPDTAKGETVNHPANLGAVYEGLAEVRGWSVETLATRVAENFGRLFGPLE